MASRLAGNSLLATRTGKASLRYLLLAIAMVVLGFGISAQSRAESYALLIGIGDYQHNIGIDFPDLAGPANDVRSMRDVVVGSGVIGQQNVSTLIDSEATRASILAELDGLVEKSQQGDNVLLFFSGHGTSSKWIDPVTSHPYVNMPDGTGALIPWDFQPIDSGGRLKGADELAAQLIIGRSDLRPRLLELDRKGVHTWVVVDACYSGNAVRSARARDKGRSRNVSFANLARRFPPTDRRAVSSTDNSSCLNCDGKGQLNVYPYNNVVFFAAAAEGELAKDMAAHETVDQQAHGALTDGLLRVFSKFDIGSFNYSDLYKQVLGEMKRFCACRQSPVVLPRRYSPSGEILQSTVLLQPARVQRLPKSMLVREPFSVEFGENAVGLRSAALAAGVPLTDEYPAVRIRRDNGAWLALDVNEELINVFDSRPDRQSMQRWLETRRWLHRRIQQDQDTSRQIEFALKQGVTGFGAVEGSELYFSVWLDKPAKLLLLDVFGDGRIRPLFPESVSELQEYRAGVQLVFPTQAGDSEKTDDIKPLLVTGPFGTDTLLLYALKPGVPDNETLLQEFYSLIQKLGPFGTLSHEHPAIGRLEAALPSADIVPAHLKVHTYPRNR